MLVRGSKNNIADADRQEGKKTGPPHLVSCLTGIQSAAMTTLGGSKSDLSFGLSSLGLGLDGGGGAFYSCICSLHSI